MSLEIRVYEWILWASFVIANHLITFCLMLKVSEREKGKKRRTTQLTFISFFLLCSVIRITSAFVPIFILIVVSIGMIFATV